MSKRAILLLLTCFACSPSGGDVDASSPDASSDVQAPIDAESVDASDAEADATACTLGADPAFGTGGLAQFAYPPYPEYRALAVQADGKIIVAGRVSGSSVALVRFLASGQPDVTFGTSGIATLAAKTNLITGVAVQSDGKIVACAYESVAGWYVVRLDAQGALDTSYGTNGYADAPPGSIVPSALAFATDGSLFVVGYVFNGQTQDGLFDYDFLLAKLDTNGKLVASFGNSGAVTLSFGPYIDQATALVVQPDGKVVLAGRTEAPSDAGNDYYLAFARVDSSTGALDTTFGSGGRVVTNLGPGDDSPAALAMDGAGNLLVAASESYTPNDDFIVIRYTSAGALDSTFGTNGVTRTDFFGAGDYPAGVDALGDRLVVSGTATIETDDAGSAVYRMVVATYTLFGAPVSTFVVPSPAGDVIDELEGQALAPDGTLVVAGYGQRGVDGGSALLLDLARIDCH